MKTYNSPMLQVVSIKNDIVTTSDPKYGGMTTATSGNLAPDRFNDWDAGY